VTKSFGSDGLSAKKTRDGCVRGIACTISMISQAISGILRSDLSIEVRNSVANAFSNPNLTVGETVEGSMIAWPASSLPWPASSSLQELQEDGNV
jgi:hypothetical protein